MDFLGRLCCRPKEYVMPIGYGDTPIILGGDGSVAVPYHDSKKNPIAPASPIWDDGDSGQEEGPEEQQGSRITTRARFTYGVESGWWWIFEGPDATEKRQFGRLERFERNALLILARTEPQGRQFVDQRVELLTRNFGAFRFDVEAHVDLDPQQVEARLEEFFSRDFSRVGAVCVAVVGGREAARLESRVLRNLTDKLPSALRGRPKIYITEMVRSGSAAVAGTYSPPITSSFPDVIAVHIPVVIEGESNPLQMLCARLGSERDFRAEVMAAAHAAETTFPALARRPIQVDSTLSLELELVRAESVPDSNGTTESVPVSAYGTTESVPVSAYGTTESVPVGANGTTESVPVGANGTTESVPVSANGTTESVPVGANGTTESVPVGANGTTENLPNGANGTSENLPDGTY